MATMYYDEAADLAIIRGKKVAILGYGSQGHAHALNLKDSGVDVRVGLAAASRSREKARAAGLTVGDPGEVTKWADVVMVLVPDTTQARLYTEEIAPNLSAGNMLMFAHGFNIRFGTIVPRPDIDVAMVAPKAPSRASAGTTSAGIWPRSKAAGMSGSNSSSTTLAAASRTARSSPRSSESESRGSSSAWQCIWSSGFELRS